MNGRRNGKTSCFCQTGGRAVTVSWAKGKGGERICRIPFDNEERRICQDCSGERRKKNVICGLEGKKRKNLVL